MSRRRVIGVAASAAVVVAIVAVVIIFTRSDDDSSLTATSPAARAHAGVCTAMALARDGDREGARRTFFDESHEPLHELAAAAAERDRGAAARLLEAKEKVESDLTGGSASLADDLGRLATRTATAITTAGDAAPEPCGQGEQ